jgi:stage II sporulation protein AA (anti-sigma F factor antagonist)
MRDGGIRVEIAHVQEGDVAVLCPTGRLDSNTSAELERACEEQMAQGTRKILFDLAGTDYVSSAGLRIFLVVGKKLQRAGGRLGLCCLSPMVREVLAISGFDRILTTAQSRGEGLAKLI